MMLLIFVWADFVADLVCSADMLIVIPAGASVDVLSDNAVHFSVLPPTTPPRHYGRGGEAPVSDASLVPA